MSYADAATTTDIYSYPIDSNRLSSISSSTGSTRTLTYDDAGNVTYDNRSGPGYGYNYDAAGRMSAFAINGVIQAEYEYNFLGQQIIRRLTQTGETIHALHDAAGNRIAEYAYDESLGTSALLREYIWADGMVVAVVEAGQMYFVRTDHIGRPIFATDTLGTKVWEASYRPFGGVQTSTGANAEIRFPGQWFQSETALHQNWMRDYDPTLGRYIQADPLGLVDGASVYGYALQNPGRYVDPRGEYTIGDAYDSLAGNGVAPDTSTNPYGYSGNQLFDAWLELEHADKGWLDNLPEACPCNINDRGEGWSAPRTDIGQTYHPGGYQEIRKLSPDGSGAGRQCVYDRSGRLMTNAPAAGTADRYLPVGVRNPVSIRRHIIHDVAPYDLALRLGREDEYYPVRPLMTGAECCTE